VLKWTRSHSKPSKGDKEKPPTPDKLLELYDQARYGEEEPSITDVAALRKQLK